ncbi:MAG: hypothetical protein ACI86M_002761 [Saprospiraceae bacterium]|jgi:hypothetical protein
MKLEQILEKLNTIEKTSFSKIIDSILTARPKNARDIDKLLLNYSDKNLRSLDSNLFSKVFELINDEYSECLNEQIGTSVSQLDILLDILIKDGNCIMSREWLGELYKKEIKKLKDKIRKLDNAISGKDITEVDARTRDFIIYKKCVETAYKNDISNNQDAKITNDEKSILNTLALNFDLSQEEVKLLNYSVLPIEKLSIDEIIDLLKNAGIILYSKKYLEVYIPDEFIRLLRGYRNKEVADKYLRRILRLLKDSEINLIARHHDIERKFTRREKVKAIINDGVGIRNILQFDIHKPETTLTEKKKRVNDIVDKGLNLDHLKGTTLDAKIDNLITYFNEIEKDEKVGISIEGYKTLLTDLQSTLPKSKQFVQKEFEIQTDEVMDATLLLEYNLKPRDILEILDDSDIKAFCDANEISTRGNELMNILDSYKDSQNIELENYADIAYRNVNALKDNGIKIKESELGLKFEELTRMLFVELGLNVDEELRKSVSTSKDKIDILLTIGDKEVILIECKSVKETGYNKFSSVSRQIKSYKTLLEKNEYRVMKSLLIAPEFTDDFVNDVEMDYDLNLSLIEASTLLGISRAFKKNKKLKAFPYMLLMKDVLIHEERIIKALNK